VPIKFERVENIAVITIDNGPLNLLTPELHRDLYKSLRVLEEDQSLQVGVLQGNGSRAFCAGDDIKSPRPTLNPEQQVRRDLFPRQGDVTDYEQAPWERDIMAMPRMKPIIAGIRGWCIGQGFIYASHLCDIRIASTESKFGLPEIAYGMSGAAAISGVLRHFPRSAAMQLALTGDPIDAHTALRIFYLNEVVDDETVPNRAMEIAKSIARHPPLALRAEMESLQRSEFLDPQATYSVARSLDRLQRLVAPIEQSSVSFVYSTKKSQ
jgi:enoyl-CoA hydratase/carnithine racemase